MTKNEFLKNLKTRELQMQSSQNTFQRKLEALEKARQEVYNLFLNLEEELSLPVRKMIDEYTQEYGSMRVETNNYDTIYFSGNIVSEGGTSLSVHFPLLNNVSQNPVLCKEVNTYTTPSPKEIDSLVENLKRYKNFHKNIQEALPILYGRLDDFSAEKSNLGMYSAEEIEAMFCPQEEEESPAISVKTGRGFL